MSSDSGTRIRTRVLQWAGAAAIVSAAWGCHTCEDHDGSEKSRELAQLNFDNEKFEQARILFTRSVEKCPDNKVGWLGLANSERAWGNTKFKEAADLASQGKIGESKRVFKDGVDSHTHAYEILLKKSQEDPESLAPHYGLGMLYYDRSTSVFPFPFPLDDQVHRTKERDLAIQEWTLVVKRAPTLWQAQRYLGLCLFSAGRMDEGSVHLNKFQEAQQALYEKVLTWPSSTDDEKKIKENSLRAVEKEITDIRELIGEYLIQIQHDIEKLKLKRGRTQAEENKMITMQAESLRIERVVKGFTLTKLTAVERDLRTRCDDYLRTFNKGEVGEIMSFIAPKEGEEAAMQIEVQDRVNQKTQYRKAHYKTIVVSGSTASVGLICDVVSSKANRPESEVTLRWRLVGGQWKVTELPNPIVPRGQ